MARHRTRLQRAFDLKPKAYALFRWLAEGRGQAQRVLSFYSKGAVPDPSNVRMLEDSLYTHPATSARYDDVRAIVTQNCVDVMRTDPLACGDWETRRLGATVANVTVLGHTLAAVDVVRARHVQFFEQDSVGWMRSFPGPAAFLKRRVEGLAIVIPPIRHFGHLLTDVLFPIAYFLMRQSWSDKRVTFILAPDSAPLVYHFLDAMNAEGWSISKIVASPFFHYECDHFLAYHLGCINCERVFGTPEVLAPLRQNLQAVLPVSTISKSVVSRLYLRRKGARLRNVEGEDRLAEMLSRENFYILEADWNNMHDQIAAFSNANVVFGVHGAGLANMLWSRADSCLIELMADNGRKTTGLHWASAACARYVPVLGGPEGHNQNFAIDVDAAFASIMMATHAHENAGRTRNDLQNS